MPQETKRDLDSLAGVGLTVCRTGGGSVKIRGRHETICIPKLKNMAQ